MCQRTVANKLLLKVVLICVVSIFILPKRSKGEGYCFFGPASVNISSYFDGDREFCMVNEHQRVALNEN